MEARVAATTKKSKLTPAASPRGELIKLTSKLVARSAAKRLPALAERASNGDGTPLIARIRSLPIQCSVDIAVPLEVAYDEWMKLEFVPEGAHRVEEIKRRGNRLRGKIA